MSQQFLHPIEQVVNRAGQSGHTILTRSLGSRLVRTMGISYDLRSLDRLYATDTIVRVGSDALSTPKALLGEARLARWLHARGGLPPLKGQSRIGEPPAGCSPSQVGAWALLRNHRTVCLTGLPGTGKTWLTARFVESAKKAGLLVKCAAPTGKAASVLSLKMGREKVTTIHRLLGIRPGMLHADIDVDADVLVVDESSMIDAELMGILADAVSKETMVVFVGDPRQLYPVGAGCPFADLVQYDILPNAHLNEVQRQAAGNGVLEMSRGFAAGKLQIPDRNVHVFKPALESIDDLAMDLYCSDRLKDRFQLGNVHKEALILSPVKDRKFEVSTLKMGEAISHRLLPERVIPKSKFTVGDRIMFTVNSPEHGFVNGEMGNLDSYNKRHAKITNDIGYTYELDGFTLGDMGVEWGYALTVHKAQGSEAKVVVLLLHPEAAHMYTRNGVYTALTRAAQDLVLVGDLRLLERALKNPEVRDTALVTLMRDADLRERVLAASGFKNDMSSLADGWPEAGF